MVLVELGTEIGSEQGKTTPRIIIQNDFGNAASPTTIVATIPPK
ncbi:MAG: type II toxin-antitoxin system PemK/MazF family toxin [archaeon]